MEPVEDFLDEVVRLILEVKRSQIESIDKAAEVMSDAVVADKLIYIWGPGGHSSIFAEDVIYRKGELASVNPILDPGISMSHGAAREINGMERVVGFGNAVIEYNLIGKDDVIVIGSAYGINPVCIEAVMECRRRGAFIISVTSRQFSDNSKYAGAKHKSNKSLYEVSDIYIDSFVFSC